MTESQQTERLEAYTAAAALQLLHGCSFQTFVCDVIKASDLLDYI